ncbi:MAG TPA: DUF177 domain-containing protein [Candidatus Eremiobacteraceae bacterium]|nr:DUF177 domain-containing protein [Candidatus Eremiobacteraceae bacterium]
MKISVDRLFHPDVQAIEVDQPLRLSGDLALRYPDGVYVNAKITPIAHGVHMQGRVSGVERETCARCLEDFARATTIEIEETFSEDVGREQDFYADVAPLVDRSIDLSDLVSQLLEVDEPIAAICSEQCLGICPACGANRNVVHCSCEARTLDARLAGLARLRDELQSDDKNVR